MQKLRYNGIEEKTINNTVGMQYVARGNAAAKNIMEHLAGNSKASAIASEVIGFYGDCFIYNESPVLPSSLFEIKMHRDTAGLEYAIIELRLGTDRTAEALSHELLHLHLGTLGYPMGNKVWVPQKLIPCSHHLINMQTLFVNLLHHELFFETFLGLGFMKNLFLSNPESPPDYETLTCNLLLSSDYIEELGFPWWCLEYFRHWLAIRHGQGEKSFVNIENLIDCASRLHPEIKKIIIKICSIVESGALKDTAMYPVYADKILRLMRMPPYSEWVYLKYEANRSPAAVFDIQKMLCYSS